MNSLVKISEIFKVCASVGAGAGAGAGADFYLEVGAGAA